MKAHQKVSIPEEMDKLYTLRECHSPSLYSHSSACSMDLYAKCHGKRDGGFVQAQHELPLGKTNWATAVADCLICQ